MTSNTAFCNLLLDERFLHSDNTVHRRNGSFNPNWAFDTFGQLRIEQFWQFKELAQWPALAGQGLLLAGAAKPTLPDIPLEEPTLIERLKAEQDLLGFPVTDHPLALFPGVHWASYCPISNLKDHHGSRGSIAGMIIEDVSTGKRTGGS